MGPVAQAEVAPSNTGSPKTMGAAGGEKEAKRKARRARWWNRTGEPGRQVEV